MADHDGIQPAVITVMPEGTPYTTNTVPIIGFAERQLDPVEGGAISIPTLLTNLKREHTLARNEKSNVLAAEKPATTIGASNTTIASELARATVFEVMGGVADSSESSSLKHQQKESSVGLRTSDVVQPLSSNIKFGDGSEPEARAPQSNKQDGPLDAGHRRFSQSQIRAASSTSSDPVAAFNAVLDRSWFTLASKDSEEDADNVHSPAINDTGNELALAAAFDKLGEGESARVEFAPDGELIGRLANASPLLLILALERISALQGRAAQRQGSAHLQRIPRRAAAT